MNTKRKTLIIISSAIAGMALIYFFIISPSIKEMQEISQQIYNQRVYLEQKYKQAQHLKQSTQDIKRIRPLIPKLTNILIPAGQELKLVTNLEQLAKKHQIKQTINLSLKNSDHQKSIVKVPIVLELQGNFIQILKYLSELEQANYYVNFHTLIFQPTDYLKKISPQMADQPTGSISAHLEGNVFWQPPAQD